MDDVVLPPELERFAAEAVASGQYPDRADLVRAVLEVIRRRDEARSAFRASVEAAQREGEQNGFNSLDDVLAELDDIIEAEERARV